MKILKKYNLLFLAIAILLISILSLISAIEIRDLKKEIKDLKVEEHFIKIALEGLYE